MSKGIITSKDLASSATPFLLFLNAGTIYETASVTQLFTGTVLAKLVNDSKDDFSVDEIGIMILMELASP